MNKKGFTLVELLAVISILAILVLISMPNIIDMYNNARKRSFLNEVETVKTELKKETFNSSLKGQKIPEVYSSFGENQLDMDGRELEYYAEMNNDGTIKYLEITDGQFYYQCKENEVCNSVSLKDNDPFIKMDYIKNNVSTEKVFVYDTLYDIYDESNTIPVIMTNVSEYDVKVIVSYNNVTLKEFVLSKNTIDQMEFVYLNQNIINSLSIGSQNSLKIDTEVNLGQDLDGEDIIVKYPYSDKVKFKRVNSDMVITNVNASLNDDKIAFNQTGIYVPKGININSLKVFVKNQSSSTYKFKNIFRDELKENVEGQINDKSYHSINIDGDELTKYQNYLNGGIYFYRNSSNDFSMDFSSQTNIQKIYFDFDKFINPGLVNDRVITIATREDSSSTTFGDFKSINPIVDGTPHGELRCSYEECFGNNKFDYTPAGGINLGLNKSTSSLQIAQSMSIDEEYSAYFTIEGNTNQGGVPDGCSGTIFAVSDDNARYLVWVGFVNNYLQIYSYFKDDSRCGQISNTDGAYGFETINLSQYSNKKVNIQITARRGGYTKVYINGEEKLSFRSGVDSINYSSATIGDLRPSRGLKYQGVLYDLAFYNKVLSPDEVRENYNYANSKWHIN